MNGCLADISNFTPQLNRRNLFRIGDDQWECRNLKEESEDLPSCVLSASLLVVHDPIRSGENQLPELAGR